MFQPALCFRLFLLHDPTLLSTSKSPMKHDFGARYLDDIVDGRNAKQPPGMYKTT